MYFLIGAYIGAIIILYIWVITAYVIYCSVSSYIRGEDETKGKYINAFSEYDLFLLLFLSTVGALGVWGLCLTLWAPIIVSIAIWYCMNKKREESLRNK